MFSLLNTFCLHFYLINIHIFDYPDSRLSGLFTEVPTSPDNRGSTVIAFILRFSPFFTVTAFSWTSFASPAFVIAQCPSNGKFVTAAALLSNKFDTTTNCEHPSLQCDSSDDWHKKSIGVDGSREPPKLLWVKNISSSDPSLSDKTTVWWLHVDWPISIF